MLAYSFSLGARGPLHRAINFEGATLAAVGAARRMTPPHEAQFRRDRAVVLRGIHSCDLAPLRKQGDPQPWEMDGIDSEMRIAAALVARLLGAPALRDPCGACVPLVDELAGDPGRPGGRPKAWDAPPFRPSRSGAAASLYERV